MLTSPAFTIAGQRRGKEMMARPRAADDFAAIRAGMEELRLERKQAALRVQSATESRLDEDRWRVADELREQAIPRRKWRAES
jgi:hypothetical protein